jgi:hypothetical protein
MSQAPEHFVEREWNSAVKNGGCSWAEDEAYSLLLDVLDGKGASIVGVYFALCFLANKESKLHKKQVQTFSASFLTISRWASCSRKSATLHVKFLEEMGFIKVKHAPKGADNNETNVYTLASAWTIKNFQRRLREGDEARVKSTLGSNLH